MILSIKNKELETKILSLATQANIPAEHVYEVNMAEKTNALNAYVTGIGSNSRIVLWDTTLNRLTDNEILFIMAHEMGHYVEKHIYFGIAGYLLLILIGLWLTAKIMRRLISRYGQVLKLIKSVAFVPIHYFTHYLYFTICLQSSIQFYIEISGNESRSVCD